MDRCGANYSLECYEEANAYIARMADPSQAARLAAASAAMSGDMRKAKTLVRKVKETYPDFDIDTWLSIVPFREQWQKTYIEKGSSGPDFKLCTLKLRMDFPKFDPGFRAHARIGKKD